MLSFEGMIDLYATTSLHSKSDPRDWNHWMTSLYHRIVFSVSLIFQILEISKFPVDFFFA